MCDAIQMTVLSTHATSENTDITYKITFGVGVRGKLRLTNQTTTIQHKC